MDDPLAIEDLLDSLGVRLWGLVAVKVAARMAVELAAVQHGSCSTKRSSTAQRRRNSAMR